MKIIFDETRALGWNVNPHKRYTVECRHVSGHREVVWRGDSEDTGREVARALLKGMEIMRREIPSTPKSIEDKVSTRNAERMRNAKMLDGTHERAFKDSC